MGLFMLSVAALLVVLQATVLLLGRGESQWGFHLTRAKPDASKWSGALDKLLAYAHQLPQSTFPGVTFNEFITKTPDNTDVLLCLEAVHGSLLGGGRSSESITGDAFDCVMMARTPRVAQEAVLDSWNPHLLLLGLCCVNGIVCLGHVYWKQEVHREDAANQRRARRQFGDDNNLNVKHGDPEGLMADDNNNNDDGAPKMIKNTLSMELIGVLMVAILASCIAVQGVHDMGLVRYPTLVVLSLWLLSSSAFVYLYEHMGLGKDLAWGLAFHQQMVAVPLATLSVALFGARQWPDLLAQFWLLSAAVNLMWLSLVTQTRSMRALVVALLGLCLYVSHVQFGAFDTWRYVAAYMGSVGLAPLVLCVLLPAARLYQVSLMACNAALLSLIMTLSQLGDP